MLKAIANRRDKRRREARNSVQWTLFGSPGSSRTFEELSEAIDMPKRHLQAALRDLVAEGLISRRQKLVVTCLGRGETVHYSLVLVTSGDINHA